MAWKGYFTDHEIIEMFPNVSIINTFLYGNKMHYLGRYENSKWWGGTYKNGENKLVSIDMCGSLEFNVVMI